MAEVADQLRGRSELMQAVYLSVIEQGAGTPEEMAEITGGNPSTVRSYARRLEKMQLLQRDSHGKYGPITETEDGPEGEEDKKGAPSLDAPKNLRLTQEQLDMLGNAAILFRDANTGEIFFSLDFPSYMRVWNPYVVTMKHPDVKNGEAEMVKKSEETE